METQPVVIGLPETRIVLFGKTGTGKSATGNTILGEERFHAEFSFIHVTKQSTAKQAVVSGRLVTVVDTPGLLDTDLSPEVLARELHRSFYETKPGPHAFLIVLQLNVRYTQQEEQVIQLFRELFGEEALKYTIILFTHGDTLEGKNIEKIIEKSRVLCDLIKLCGQRYHVFNNKDMSNKAQVAELLKKIDTMVEEYDQEFFNKMIKDSDRLSGAVKEYTWEMQKHENEQEYLNRDTEESVRKDAEERMKGSRSKHELEKLGSMYTREMLIDAETYTGQERILKEKYHQDKQRQKRIVIRDTEEEKNQGAVRPNDGYSFMKRHWMKLVIGAVIGGIFFGGGAGLVVVLQGL